MSMNNRIRIISSMVTPGSILADIGTDHAQLPILLVKNHVIDKAYACDITEGPLNAARENINKEGLKGQIIPILSNGFENVPDDVNCAVIAGMGFYTAREILEEGFDKARKCNEVIVQVNNDVPYLRKWVSDHQWTIKDEIAILDKNKFYTAIKISFDSHEPYSEEEVECGPVLMTQQSEIYVKMAKSVIEKCSRLIELRKNDCEGIEKLRIQRMHWQNAIKKHG